jgi:DNA-nicking Smr family endonuclease
MKKRDKQNKNKDDDVLWQEVAKTVNPLPQDMIWPQPNKTPKLGLPIQKPSGKNNTVDHAPDKYPAAKHYLNISSFTTNMTSRLSSNRELKPADLTAEKVSGISRTDAKRIRSGQVMPTARLDLHGMTKDNARIALRRFISDRQMENHQHVLVITGKGTAGKGVIRQALPNWLDEAPLSEQVVAYHTAKPKDGGTGAWYLKLRQKP